MTRLLRLALLALPLAAHVGSPDVFFDGKAGPYSLFVVVRPPAVIPGVAEIEVRSSAPGIREVRITPLPLTGDAAKFAPTPDLAQRSKDDPQFFTGSLWMMVSGSWQVRVQATGEQGSGSVSVPVPAVARSTKQMDMALGALLAVLGLILATGVVSIVGAASREAQLEPGMEPDNARRSRARRWMAITSAIVVGILYLGNLWWKAEANAYDRYIYKPLQMDASVREGKLTLRLSDPGWIRSRQLDDLIPDHTHLMHLFAIRLPDMERIWHLHPEMRDSGVFEHALPAMPAGRYQLYADIVHKTGFPETLTAEVEMPQIPGAPLEGDDSYGVGAPLSAANFDLGQVALSGGAYRLRFRREPGGYTARKPYLFRFDVLDETGQPAKDMELYMGMPGHAAFLRNDRGVFAHVHPSGTAPMAAVSLTPEAQADPHAAHAMHTASVPSEISFPYGFPRGGDYRIYVQVKRAGKVETGLFDVRVAEAAAATAKPTSP